MVLRVEPVRHWRPEPPFGEAEQVPPVVAPVMGVESQADGHPFSFAEVDQQLFEEEPDPLGLRCRWVTPQEEEWLQPFRVAE